MTINRLVLSRLVRACQLAQAKGRFAAGLGEELLALDEAVAALSAADEDVRNRGRLYAGVVYSPLQMQSAKRGSNAWLAAVHGTPCQSLQP